MSAALLCMKWERAVLVWLLGPTVKMVSYTRVCLKCTCSWPNTMTSATNMNPLGTMWPRLVDLQWLSSKLFLSSTVQTKEVLCGIRSMTHLVQHPVSHSDHSTTVEDQQIEQRGQGLPLILLLSTDNSKVYYLRIWNKGWSPCLVAFDGLILYYLNKCILV